VSQGKEYRSVVNIIHKFTGEVCAKKTTNDVLRYRQNFIKLIVKSIFCLDESIKFTKDIKFQVIRKKKITRQSQNSFAKAESENDELDISDYKIIIIYIF